MMEFDKNDLILFSENNSAVPYQIRLEKALIELLKDSNELKFSKKIFDKYFENKLPEDSKVSIDGKSLIHLTALFLSTYNKNLLPYINTEGERELRYKNVK